MKRHSQRTLPRQSGARVAGPDAGLLLTRALQQHQTGQLDLAERLYRDVLRIVPQQPDALHLLGVVALQRGCPADAVTCIRQALRLRPEQSVYHGNLGVALQSLGQIDAARASLERAVAIDPSNVDATFNLGVTLQSLHLLDDAAERYRQTLLLRPGHPGALHNLGNALQALGRGAEAVPVLLQAVAATPTDGQVLRSLGTALASQGQLDDAVAAFEAATRLAPADPDACLNLAVAHHRAGHLPGAIDAYRAALALRPDHAETWHSLGRALRSADDAVAAAECFERALAALDARESDAALRVRVLCDLGSTLHTTGRTPAALAAYRAASELDPDDAEAWYGLGVTLQSSGALDAAIDAFDRGCMLDPANVDAHTKLVFARDIRLSTTAADAFASRRRWDELHARPLLALARPHVNTRDPERRIRVGYVSADFYRHSASTSYLPIVEAHDPAVVETFCYASNTRQDDQTDRFRAASMHWRSVADLSDEALAEQVRTDQIDMLVDLSGHSGGHRLLAFARKPAPIQVTAWGYATGTGLDAMDVFFADPVVVPPADAHFYAEEIVYLPSVTCYTPPGEIPAVGPLPALEHGYPTFGAFNRADKTTAETLAVWAQILLAVPTARLLIKLGRQDSPEIRARLVGTLAAHGVDADRIDLAGGGSHLEHLATFGRVDVHLDTFPQGGGVTTNESLLMGVPCVTLYGERVSGRTAASYLTAVGLSDLVARSTAEYVSIASRLATDLSRLAHERATLRERLLASPVGDAVAYTRAVEAAYRTLWQRWCGQHSGVSSQQQAVSFQRSALRNQPSGGPAIAGPVESPQ
jgi:predicted O-linked N-acetylglucosamine transferase (SPINDLY family)